MSQIEKLSHLESGLKKWSPPLGFMMCALFFSLFLTACGLRGNPISPPDSEHPRTYPDPHLDEKQL